ncbi:MAG: host specificity factor TipJ family phage tail protein, partial [Janthinobacterium lividum]
MELIDVDGSVITPGCFKVTPHPLTLTGQRRMACDLLPREYLGSFLRRHVDDIDSGIWIVTIGGFEIPPSLWDKCRPNHGAFIECRAIVKKSAIGLIAVVALATFAPELAGAAYSAFGGTYVAANAGLIVGGISAAITVGGSLIINKVLSPKTVSASALASSEASPTYKLGGGRNRARPYEPLGFLLGSLRVTPDYASVPYTFFDGEDQILYSMFHAGINVNVVRDLRIGTTPLSSYSDFTTTTRDLAGMPQQDMEGWGNVDTIEGAQLLNDGTTGAYVTRTSSAEALLLQIDLEGTLYAVNADGSYERYGAAFFCQYRLLPNGPWVEFFDESHAYYTGGGSITIYSVSTTPIRHTFTKQVPVGQYEVRVIKVTADFSTSTQVSQFSFSQLRTIQPDGGQYGGMGRYGLRIKATGQLNGTLDELSWVADAKPMPYYDGSAWVTATTRENGLSNPGAQFLQFARGIYGYDPRVGQNVLLAGMGLDDSMIDIESLQGFMVRCAAMGFTFDNWFDSTISSGDVLDAICAVGMGSVTWQSGKLGVVWAAENQPIEGVVNMATMKAKSFSVNYQTLETADGIEYAYYDRDRDFSWQTLRVSDPSIPVTLNPSRLTSVGVTSQAHAAILARFHMGQSVYQRKDISYETDIEHLTYKRMSVMALTHDVTQWGYGGRLISAVNAGGFLTLTLDDIVPAGSGAGYIGLRVPGERGYRVFGVAAFSGSSRTLTLTTAWPAGVAIPGDSAVNRPEDTIWIYDFKATPGYRVRVTSIQPQANLAGATVTVVPDSPEFWNYVLNGAYVPPVNQSLLANGVPVLTNVVVTEELQRQGNGFADTLTISFDVSGNYSFAEVFGTNNGGARQRLGATSGRAFSFSAGLDDSWAFELVPYDPLGRKGSSSTISYAVQGLREPPPNVTGLQFADPIISWDAVAAADLAGYVLRYNLSHSLDWEHSIPLHFGIVTEATFSLPSIAGDEITVLARAVDTTGNLSAMPAVVYGSLIPPSVETFSITNGVLSWPPVAVGDLRGYVLRFQYGENRVWSNASNLHDGVVTQSPFKPELIPPGVCTLMIKAVDMSGNESLNAAVIVANLGDVIVENLILTYDDQAAGFPGAKTNGTVSNGTLVANDTGGKFWLDDDAPHFGRVAENYWAL